MSLDNYVTLGRSGLKVSPFCLGAMTFGQEWGFGADAQTSTAILDTYIDRGGNFIDTANLYNAGSSERIIGDYINGDAALRHKLVIATKFSANMHPGNVNAGGASRKAIVAACEESLRRLKTDYIDLYWQHWYDPFTPVEETMRALDDLVSSGKVLYIGVSDTPAWKVTQAQLSARFNGWAPLVALQIEYSLLERTVEADLIPMAQEMGLGVTPWGPLRAGMLSGKYQRGNLKAESAGRQQSIARNDNDHAFDVVDVVVKIAEQRNTSPAQVALAWLLSRSGVASPIIGARTLAQLTDNLAALEVKLAPEEIAELDAISKPRVDFPHEFLVGALQSSYAGSTVNGRSFGAHAYAKKG